MTPPTLQQVQTHEPGVDQTFLDAVAPYYTITAEIYGEDVADNVANQLAESWELDPRIVMSMSARFAAHADENPLVAYCEATELLYGSEEAARVAEFFQETLAVNEDELAAEVDALDEVQDELEDFTEADEDASSRVEQVDARDRGRVIGMADQLARYVDMHGIELDTERLQEFVAEATLKHDNVDDVTVAALNAYLRKYYPEVEQIRLLNEHGFLQDGEGKGRDALDKALDETFSPRLRGARGARTRTQEAERLAAAQEPSAGADIFDELAAELQKRSDWADDRRSAKAPTHKPQAGVHSPYVVAVDDKLIELSKATEDEKRRGTVRANL